MDQRTPSDVTERRPISSPELPETHERQCPSCHGLWIVHAGHVIASKGMLKSEQRCEVCGTAFWFVRKQIPLSGALAARLEDSERQDQASPAS
jgi:hypothetical protein